VEEVSLLIDHVIYAHPDLDTACETTVASGTRRVRLNVHPVVASRTN
jgi:hypothetical protein